jgi:predicted nucleotidyltransferase
LRPLRRRVRFPFRQHGDYRTSSLTFFSELETTATKATFGEVKSMPKASLRALKSDFEPFCQKYGLRSLAVFGSLARGDQHADSDLDLLVEPAEATTIPEILEMAGEAEEIAGRPVDFVLRNSLMKTLDRNRTDHILSTAVFLYGH